MDLNNILIGSDNPKALIDYYTKLFGEPGMADESYSGWAIGSGFIAVGAHSEVHGRNESPGRLIWNISSDDVQGISSASRPPAPSSSRRRTPSRWKATRRPGSPPSKTPTATTSS
jgi:hypothetical protein